MFGEVAYLFDAVHRPFEYLIGDFLPKLMEGEMKNAEIIDRISRGQKVLVPCQYFSAHTMPEKIEAFAARDSQLLIDWQRSEVLHPSGGLAHFAVNDEVVSGREYHAVGQYPTREMRSRAFLTDDTLEG